jgi:cephalosporin-C deacetylase-like acetyl esterase
MSPVAGSIRQGTGDMKQGMRIALFVVMAALLSGGLAFAADPPPLAWYFHAETARIARRPLVGIGEASEWKASRPRLQRELKEMLGLWPTPNRTDLHVETRGTIDRPDFVIEKVLFQSAPGLYVTGNLYRPKTVDGRLPAILYVCGHSKVEKDGLIIGNKAHYQHHAAWFAANGYVCLIIDTLQLGELPGLHHGTAKEGMWWWYSRGYTPAGLEAWNGVRAIDYLVSRPDVDASKIGVTGRSGGGATSWWLGAIDDRIAAVAPVAGITDLQNHVVDGVVQGHCDCMYIVNTYRWDYDTLAALVAPKPLLVENTDKDPIFPLDGVRRIYEQLQRVYEWYGVPDRLGLVIGKGGHADTTELRHPAFAFFEKWLKNKPDPAIVEPDRTTPIEQLKVLNGGENPEGNQNAKIHETFVAKASPPLPPKTKEEFRELRSAWQAKLRELVFRGWPGDRQTIELNKIVAFDFERDDVRFRAIDFNSQVGIRLRLGVVTTTKDKPAAEVAITIGDQALWKDKWSWLGAAGTSNPEGQGEGQAGQDELVKSARRGVAQVAVFPRGVGPTAWPAELDTHVRRRFELLGQTWAGMQVWDVRRALATMRTLPDLKGAKITMIGSGASSAIALWAGVFEPEIDAFVLTNLPSTVREGPALLNLERVLEMPQALALLAPRKVRLVGADRKSWAWSSDAAHVLDAGAGKWPEFRNGSDD